MLNNTEKLIKIIGTPFGERNNKLTISDKELIDIYDIAFTNRVALLYLSNYRQNGWDKHLEERYEYLRNREIKTYDVISNIAEKLNNIDKNNYIVFKSIKPYPATPNDTDVIYLGNKKEYKIICNYLLENGYGFHEWAPQQKTFYDLRGKDSIGKGKKGGVYYIDFYEEISTDYYSYANKQNLKKFIVKKELNGIEVNFLASEAELAIIMFHNVFPERTFQLEHFYVPIYYLHSKEFKLNIFIKFIRDNNMVTAIRANLTLIDLLHKKSFGFSPPPVEILLSELGSINFEGIRFIKKNYETPYMFSPKIFWWVFIGKSLELYSLKSLLIQLLKMTNPKFFLDVLRSLKKRFSEKGTYHLE